MNAGKYIDRSVKRREKTLKQNSYPVYSIAYCEEQNK